MPNHSGTIRRFMTILTFVNWFLRTSFAFVMRATEPLAFFAFLDRRSSSHHSRVHPYLDYWGLGSSKQNGGDGP